MKRVICLIVFLISILVSLPLTAQETEEDEETFRTKPFIFVDGTLGKPAKQVKAELTFSTFVPKSAPSQNQQDLSPRLEGRITYFNDNSGDAEPIRSLKLILFYFDENKLHESAKTYTDSNGMYYIALDEEASKHPLKLIARFKNEVIVLTRESGHIYESTLAEGFGVPDEGSRFDFHLGEYNPLRGLGYMNNTFLDAHEFIMKEVLWTRARIKIVWPASGNACYNYSYNPLLGAITKEYIDIPLGKEWDRPTLLHEYGHAVMTSIYRYRNDYLPEAADIEQHSVPDVISEGHAMREGWAEFFQAYVDDNAFNLTAYTNAQVPNIEENAWWTGDAQGNGGNTQGELVEGAVASILWDICDTKDTIDHLPDEDDDLIHNRLIELWEVMVDSRPKSILEFWDGWCEKDFAQQKDLYTVFGTHGVNVPKQNIYREIIGESPIGRPDIIDAILEYLAGDVNGDGEVNTTDAVMILQIAAGSITPTEKQRLAADVDGDNAIDSQDAILILEEVTKKAANPESVKSDYFRPIVPKHNHLYQNFPNPCNPETWIPFQLSEESDVTIRIYNAAGNLIRTLLLGSRQAGVYLARGDAAYWDGNDRFGQAVSSGLYFYVLRSNNFTAMGKMIVLK